MSCFYKLKRYILFFHIMYCTYMWHNECFSSTHRNILTFFIMVIFSFPVEPCDTSTKNVLKFRWTYVTWQKNEIMMEMGICDFSYYFFIYVCATMTSYLYIHIHLLAQIQVEFDCKGKVFQAPRCYWLLQMPLLYVVYLFCSISLGTRHRDYLLEEFPVGIYGA